MTPRHIVMSPALNMPLTPALSPQAGRGRAAAAPDNNPQLIMPGRSAASPLPVHGERDRVRGYSVRRGAVHNLFLLAALCALSGCVIEPLAPVAEAPPPAPV